MTIRKIALAIALAAMMVFSAVAFVGCGSSAEDAIKKDIKTELDAVKNQDGEFAEMVEQSFGGDALAQYGIDGKEFLKTYFDGFDYTIGEVKVDGDKATASVTLKIKSASGFQTAIDEATQQMLSDSSVYSMSQDDRMAKYGELMMTTLKDVPVTETQPISLSYTKDGDKWVEDEANAQAISDAMDKN